MSLETIPQKQLSELEIKVRELLGLMHRARLQKEPLSEALRVFENELSEIRRQRYDAMHTGYPGGKR